MNIANAEQRTERTTVPGSSRSSTTRHQEHFAAYINTWSAVKHFIAKNESNPVDAILPAIEEAWGQEPASEVRFPVLLRVVLVT